MTDFPKNDGDEDTVDSKPAMRARDDVDTFRPARVDDRFRRRVRDDHAPNAALHASLRAAAEHKERTVHNEDFLNELRKADLTPEDGEFDADLEQEFSHWFSGAKAVTNRGDQWDLEADLIMQNKRERAVAERRPGRLLQDRPFMLAAMRGDESPPADAYAMDGIPGDPETWAQKTARMDTTTEPMTSEQMSRVYGAAEVAADIMTLSRNAAGLESVSTVKTETNVRREQEDESTASRVGRVLE